jgi:hypothetical protein
MRKWRFGKPTGPGFGISAGYYLTVLSPEPAWPAAVSLANPDGAAGAVAGFAVPVNAAPSASAGDRSVLGQPMQRGIYAVASKDRKTVLRMMLMSKEEAGFEPEAFVRNAEALNYPPDMVVSIRATWTIAQFTFESHDPDVYPSLDFLLAVSDRLASLVGGVVADPLSRRYRRSGTLFANPRADERVDAREHVSVHSARSPGGISYFTLGLQKFGLPEFEVSELGPDDSLRATTMLAAMAQTVLVAGPVREGQAFASFTLHPGGFDRSRWEGIPVLELRPRANQSASDALALWPA